MRYFGDYELLEEIARGGMGVVYRARQVSLNRIVALKMILAGRFASPADVQRFHPRPRRRPISTIPTSCPSTKSANTRASTYFSMKLIEGGSLSDCRLPLPARRAAKLAWPLCRGRSTMPTSAASCTAT